MQKAPPPVNTEFYMGPWDGIKWAFEISQPATIRPRGHFGTYFLEPSDHSFYFWVETSDTTINS